MLKVSFLPLKIIYVIKNLILMIIERRFVALEVMNIVQFYDQLAGARRS
jgi:hypothetical protein